MALRGERRSFSDLADMGDRLNGDGSRFSWNKEKRYCRKLSVFLNTGVYLKLVTSNIRSSAGIYTDVVQ